MINRSVLVGRLTKDPELRYTPNGVAVCRFTLAVNRPFSNPEGEKKADFINIIVWRKQAENAANFLRKGSLAGIDGRIQTGSFEGQDGKRVYTTEVVADSVQYLDNKSNSNQESSTGNNQNPNYNQNQNSNQGYGNGQGNYQGQPDYGYQPNASQQGDYNNPNSYGNQPEEDDLPF
ncbi:single-stranded DNA-binding protein [Rummeliibacillus stabekisii]|uniref:single-stranded DNA-binding protein n=1 Tax=Rummeliibacillus stabekisii TaxID=241244 RepID=UPI00203E2CF2|nr:single-stranded DNA-binding protein [Rummeliibacillus stabekisii]MCM3317994.1 single-stranded DNA-binding protein [Rummeliibacillus stabekisii]